MTVTSSELEAVFIGARNPKCSTRWWDIRNGVRVLAFECGAEATHLVRAHSNVGRDHDIHSEPMCERCLNEALLIECEQHQVRVVVSWTLL